MKNYDVRIQGPAGVRYRTNLTRARALTFLKSNTQGIGTRDDLLFAADQEGILNVSVKGYDIGIESFEKGK